MVGAQIVDAVLAGMLLSACSEKVVVAICHTRCNQQMKNTQIMEYCTVITGVGASCRYLDITQRRNCTRFGSMSDPSKNLLQKLNSDAWKQFFMPCPMMCPTVLLYAGTVEGGAGIDQWANVWGSTGRSGVSRTPPLPFHPSMCLLFTCKMWFSPPCSSHTLKTGTPCYDPALPANIK